ncbi:MAG: 2-keto-4-pentenoate hydratase [Alphaproteobacteria bacterium]
MDTKQIADAAAKIADARRANKRIDRLPEGQRPMSVAEGHAIQDAVTALLATPIGAYKANAPAAAPVVREGVRAPIFAPQVGPTPGSFPAASIPQLGVEGEVAFRFTRDLPPRATPYTEAEVVGALEACAAIEVCGSRWADDKAAGLPEKIADCVSNVGFVHGPIVKSWGHLDFGTIKVELLVNDRPVLTQEGGHPGDGPVGVAVALVEMLRGTTGVKAGQFVTCGSYTGLRYVEPGDTCRVRFAGLGEAEVSFPTG